MISPTNCTRNSKLFLKQPNLRIIDLSHNEFHGLLPTKLFNYFLYIFNYLRVLLITLVLPFFSSIYIFNQIPFISIMFLVEFHYQGGFMYICCFLFSDVGVLFVLRCLIYGPRSERLLSSNLHLSIPLKLHPFEK